MKHTPGPWHIWKEDIGREKNQRISGADGFCLAIAYGDGEPGEVSSNARLIAAAPEMYEALKTIIDKADSDPFATIGMFVEHGKGANLHSLIARIEGKEEGK